MIDFDYLAVGLPAAVLGLVLGYLAFRRAMKSEAEQAAATETKPPTEPNTGPIDDFQKILWEHSTKQDEYIVTQFGVAIIGIGALFFAFGELKGQRHFQELVALIGLAASVIVWMHSWGARRESRAFRKAFSDDRLKSIDDLRGWRHRGGYAFVYFPVTRLIVYFSGLVALAWLNLILSSAFNLDFFTLLLWDIGVFVTVAAYAVTLHALETCDLRAKEAKKGSASPAQGGT